MATLEQKKAILERIGIARWLITGAAKASEKQIEEKAHAYAALLFGRPISDKDLSDYGVVWPANARVAALREKFLNLVKAIQAKGGKSSKGKAAFSPRLGAPGAPGLKPENVVARKQQKDDDGDDDDEDGGDSGDEEDELEILPGVTFDLPKALLTKMTKYTKTKDPQLLVTIGGNIFEALEKERVEQKTTHLRHVNTSAFTNDVEVKNKQKEIIAAFPADKLQLLVSSVNDEVDRYTALEAKYDEIVDQTLVSGTQGGKPIPGIKAIRANQVDIDKAKADLAKQKKEGATEKKIKAAENALKRAKKTLQDNVSAAANQILSNVKTQFFEAMEKRLAKVFLNAAATDAPDFGELTEKDFQDATVKFLRKRFKERKTSKEYTSKELYAMTPQQLKNIQEDEGLRETLTFNLAKNRKDLSPAERATLVSGYLSTRAQLRAVTQNGEPGDESELGAKLDAYDAQFRKPSAKDAKNDDDDESDEEDEDFKPDESSDEEEEDDDEEEAAAAGGAATNPSRRTKPPKTYSGAGSFAHPMLHAQPHAFGLAPPHPQHHAMHPGFARPHPMMMAAAPLRGLSPLANAKPTRNKSKQTRMTAAAAAAAFRAGGAYAAQQSQQYLPHFPAYPPYFPFHAAQPRFMGGRAGGGCGCDAMSAPPADDDL